MLLTLKALHLIFVVTWFAGLFYLVRLFIYDVEARTRPAEESRILTRQFSIMERRLWYGITVPSAWLTLLLGGTLMVRTQAWQQPWFHAKAALLVALYAYHFHCGWLRRRLEAGLSPLSSRSLRVHNEVATLFLVSIVPLAVLRDVAAPLPFVAGFLALAAAVFGVLRLRGR